MKKNRCVVVSFMCATPKELPADCRSKHRDAMCRTMGPGGPCHSEVCLLLLLLLLLLFLSGGDQVKT